mgnify:CR=1 FL=1
MPWPATHILIAEKVYDQYFSHLDRKDFLLGTSFPDIRYPAKLNRHQTHLPNRSFQEIQSQNAFTAGMMFHSFVDKLWNVYIDKDRPSLLSAFPWNIPMLHTMKVLQDVFLYDRYKEWLKIAQYFSTILPEESHFGAGGQMIVRWHDVLAYYLSKPPTIDDLEMLHISLPSEVIEEIRRYYLAYQENAALKSSMTGFYNQIVILIENA